MLLPFSPNSHFIARICSIDFCWCFFSSGDKFRQGKKIWIKFNKLYNYDWVMSYHCLLMSLFSVLWFGHLHSWQECIRVNFYWLEKGILHERIAFIACPVDQKCHFSLSGSVVHNLFYWCAISHLPCPTKYNYPTGVPLLRT